MAKIVAFPGTPHPDPRGQHPDVARRLGQVCHGLEIFSRLLQEFGNGPAPPWLDRFCEDMWGADWATTTTVWHALVFERGGK
jgi:hypothetical protein